MKQSVVAIAVTFGLTLPAIADTISTAVGNGADVEMRERLDDSSLPAPPGGSAGNGNTLNTRTSADGNRNEIVGLRFDLGGYTLSNLTSVALNVINYRTNLVRVVEVYGVAPGTLGGTGSYDTESWSETAVTVFGDLPGLEISDDDPATQSLHTGSLTYLGQFTGSVLDEGTMEIFAAPALTTFIQDHAGSGLVTLLLAAGNGSSGQFRFASNEATELATPGLFTKPAGGFGPFLEFAAAPHPPAPGLVITRIELAPGGVALAGTGGPSDGDYVVLETGDLRQDATNWAALSTNRFDGNGDFSVTNPTAAGTLTRFYRLLSLPPAGPDFSLIGFAGVDGDTTGGAGGLTQIVSTAAAFTSAVGASGPRIVLVDGFIEFDGGLGSVNINSDKTILGLGTNASISGQLSISGETNVIIRNLTISNNGAPGVVDGVRIVNGAHHVWVDHCTFVDCSDGELDITLASDYVSISWCKFMYVNQTEHNFVNLIAASETDAGDYRITFHHNWWSTGCKQRMPMSRYGTVHLFNNFYYAPANQYCSQARTNAQFLSEHNYYRMVDDPIYKVSTGRIRTAGNIYFRCSGQIDPGRDTLDPVLSPPPYAYVLDPAVDVPSIVTNNAGAGTGPYAP